MVSLAALGAGATGATVVTAAVLDLGIGLTAAGQLASGAAQAQQAESQAAMAEYNAKVQQQEAKAIEQRNRFEQKRQAQEAARISSGLQADLAASGAVSTEGTPLLIQAKQAAENELDNLLIGYEGMINAARARSQAGLEQMQAGIYRRKAGSSRVSGYLGAGSTLLTGFSQMAYLNR